MLAQYKQAAIIGQVLDSRVKYGADAVQQHQAVLLEDATSVTGQKFKRGEFVLLYNDDVYADYAADQITDRPGFEQEQEKQEKQEKQETAPETTDEIAQTFANSLAAQIAAVCNKQPEEALL